MVNHRSEHFPPHFVAFLGFEDFEDLFGLGFGGISHGRAGGLSVVGRIFWCRVRGRRMDRRHVNRLDHVANPSPHVVFFPRGRNKLKYSTRNGDS